MSIVDLRALRIVSILSAITLPVALFAVDWSSSLVLSVSTVGWTLPSLLIGRHSGDADRGPTKLLAEVAVSWTMVAFGVWVVTWALASVAGSGSVLTDPASAGFEAVSGISTTGLSMVDSPEELNLTLQWWRSVLQWGGAVGVVVFALFVAERSGDRDDDLRAEWGEYPGDGQRSAVRLILVMLTALTVVCGVGLWLFGDRPWVALNHAMTAASTGGFSVASGSAAESPAGARVVLIIAMLASATSFATAWGAVTGKGPAIWRRTQVRWSVLMVLGLAVASTLAGFGEANVGDLLFNAVSATSTAGFSAGDAHQRIPAVAVATVVSMFIGGAAGSTAGGVKVARVAWLTKAACRWLPQGGEVYGNAFVWDGEEVDPTEAAERITGAGSLVAVWMAAVIAATYGLAVTADVGALDAAFESVSAMSGVGLSRGVTGHELAIGPKLILAAAMLLGRVEITAFVALAARLTAASAERV